MKTIREIAAIPFIAIAVIGDLAGLTADWLLKTRQQDRT